MRIFLCILLGCSCVMAQPKVTAVANGADFSSPIAPGSLASVFGSGLSAQPVSASAVPLPTTLSGVAVTVNGKPVPLTFANAGQINFQLPYGTPTGSATLTVTNNGQVSNSVTFSVAAYAPGIFQYGAARGVIQNQDYSLNDSTKPAAPGSVVTVYLTGIGITNPAVPDGNIAPSSPLAKPLATGSATIGNTPATLLFLGLTPGNVGLAQANIQIPALVTDGDYPLYIQLGTSSSKPVTISVQGAAGARLPTGASCISGTVDSITFSLQYKTPGLADEVVIGGTMLCAKCTVKPPVYDLFVHKLEQARDWGTHVDACYDASGSVNLVRVRP